MRNILAEMLSEAVRDVETEPRLWPLSGEDLPYATADRIDEARLDIRARGFWTMQQDAYCDVRVTHPKASVLSGPEVLNQLRAHERQKKQQYGATEVERGSFAPLVFTMNMGWRGRSARDSWRPLPVGSGSAIKTSDIKQSSVPCVFGRRSALYIGQ